MPRVTSLEKPVERLAHAGVDALALEELIALVLQEPDNGRPAIDVARGLVRDHGNLLSLATARQEELANYPGMNVAMAAASSHRSSSHDSGSPTRDDDKGYLVDPETGSVPHDEPHVRRIVRFNAVSTISDDELALALDHIAGGAGAELHAKLGERPKFLAAGLRRDRLH